eukprot:258421-Rhodomonas_salina.3
MPAESPDGNVYSCRCPSGTFGDGFACTPCPHNASLAQPVGHDVHMCPCASGMAMAFDWIVDGIPHEECVPFPNVTVSWTWSL